MRTVVIESPFEGGTAREAANVEYAKRCMNDALRRNEAPFLSHLIYPHSLDDTIPEQRELGIQAGHAVAARMEIWAIYLDRGVTRGMLQGIDAAVTAGFRPVHVGFDDQDGYDYPYAPREKRIVFRTFADVDGDVAPDDVAKEIRLNQCVHWPVMLAHFEAIARQSWDLPRMPDHG